MSVRQCRYQCLTRQVSNRHINIDCNLKNRSNLSINISVWHDIYRTLDTSSNWSVSAKYKRERGAMWSVGPETDHGCIGVCVFVEEGQAHWLYYSLFVLLIATWTQHFLYYYYTPLPLCLFSNLVITITISTSTFFLSLFCFKSVVDFWLFRLDQT